MSLALLHSLYNPLGAEPGFLMPLCELDGVTVAQAITHDTRISHFSQIELDADSGKPAAIQASMITDIDDDAVFAFKEPAGNVVFGNYSKLSRHLRTHLDRYRHLPELLYDVGQFIHDPQVVRHASDFVQTTFDARQYAAGLDPDFNFNMFCLFEEVRYLQEDIELIRAHNADAENFLTDVREEKGATIFSGVGHLDRWHFREIEKSVQIGGGHYYEDLHLQYYQNDYTKTKIVHGVTSFSFVHLGISVQQVWSQLDSIRSNVFRYLLFDKAPQLGRRLGG